ncbi:MAG: GHMP kinase [Acidobacteria bacterium]|nr:GHMP kinase [Acidobacteriota bacterium]
MIVVRTPFRISFVGGGSDLPAFYRQAPGAVVSTTIDKYMYIVIHPYFHDKIRIKYSRTEDVDSAAEIQHPLVRECLQRMGVEKGMEIASFADVPAGTGMGSSSAFTVGLLHALYALRGETPTPAQLAEESCQVEIERVGEPIGKQDQYAAAYGGLNYMRFHANESVEVEPIVCTPETRAELERHLMLFYAGQERPARSILEEQGRNMEADDKFRRVAQMAELAGELRRGLEQGRLHACGEILDQGWRLKSGVATGISNELVETSYRKGREAGALGGKLLGAGGGGFLLLFCPPGRQAAVRAALAPLRNLLVGLSQGGSQVIYNDAGEQASQGHQPQMAVPVFANRRGGV